MTVTILIILYAVFFSAVALQRYRSFSFHDVDLAIINQAVWNTAHGRFVSQQFGEGDLISGHKWLIIFPILPLYLLFPGPPLLLFLQSVALATGAWAVFILAKKLANVYLGLAMAFVYLIYPAIQFVNLFEFHPIAFSTPLLLYAFYFLQVRKWGWYLAFVLFSLSVRQDVAISVFALGVYALIDTRCEKSLSTWKQCRWGVVPICSALIWFYVCVSVIPRLAPGPSQSEGPNMVESFFGWLGSTPVEVVKTVLTRPVYVLRGVFTAPKLTYVWHLLSPVSLLPLLSPAGLLMVVISMAEGLLSERFSHFSIRYQYSSIITPMVFAASCLGLRNMLRWRPLRGKSYYLAGLVIISALLAAWSFGPLPQIPRQFASWQFTYEDTVRQTMVETIPPAAPVVATFQFAPKLSNRPQLFYFYVIHASLSRPHWFYRTPIMQNRAEYVIADFNDWLTFYDFYTPGGDRAVYSFLREGNWELAATVNSLALFRRGEIFSPGVVETVPAEEGGEFRAVPGLPGLEAGPAQARPGRELGFDVLRFSADLRAARPIPDDYLFIARLVNRSAPERFVQQFLYAPYRVYPTSRWPAGETVRIRANILLPEDLPPGTWDLLLFGLARKPGLQLPPEAAAAFYRHFDTAMALNYLPRMWGVPPDQLLDQHRIIHLPAVLTTP